MRHPRPLLLLLRALALPVATVAFASSPIAAASAQPTDPGAEADRLNAEGKKLALAGELEPARANLEQAWGLKKAYDIAGNLALVETRLGAHDLALEHVEFAIRTFPASGKPEHKKGLETQATELRPKVVKLEISAVPVGTVLTINGRTLTAPVDGNVYALPGKVTVRAEHTGDEPASFEGTGNAGASLVVPLELKPKKLADGDPPFIPPIKPPPPPSKPAWPIVLGTVVGVTGVSLGAGLLIGGAVKSGDADDLAASSTCKPVSQACITDGQALADARGAFNTAGIVAFSVGGAALVGTLIYALIPGPKATAAPASGAITLVPFLSPHAQGAFLSGAF